MSDTEGRRGANAEEMNDDRTHRLDRSAAEALLGGGPAARRGAGPLGDLLTAAAAPGRPQELTGRAAALAAFQAASREPFTPPRRTSMLKTWLAKLLTVKVAAVVLAAGAGGVALASSAGVLPNPLSKSSTKDHPGAGPSAKPTNSPKGKPTAMPTAALNGLCQAYSNKADNDRGKALDSPAFAALVAAAGGADKVDAFCATVLAAKPGNTAHPTGKPTTDPGAGHRPTDKPGGRPTDPAPTKPAK